MIASLQLTSNFNLSSLPPTTLATRQHSFRVYHQIQTLLGNEIEPTKWEWKIVKNILVPIPTTEKPAPDNLLKLIACNCKGNCNTGHCECKRSGLLCSPMCATCQGLSCENVPEIEIEIVNEDHANK